MLTIKDQNLNGRLRENNSGLEKCDRFLFKREKKLLLKIRRIFLRIFNLDYFLKSQKFNGRHL